MWTLLKTGTNKNGDSGASVRCDVAVTDFISPTAGLARLVEHV